MHPLLLALFVFLGVSLVASVVVMRIGYVMKRGRGPVLHKPATRKDNRRA